MSEELTVTSFGPILICFSEWVLVPRNECRIYTCMPLYAWVSREIYERLWGLSEA